AQDQLVAQGYTRGTTGNSPAAAHSSIHYAANEKAEATALSSLVGDVPLVVDRKVPAKHLELYVGKDFDGVTANPTNGFRREAAPPTTSAAAPVITAEGVPCVN